MLKSFPMGRESLSGSFCLDRKSVLKSSLSVGFVLFSGVKEIHFRGQVFAYLGIMSGRCVMYLQGLWRYIVKSQADTAKIGKEDEKGCLPGKPEVVSASGCHVLQSTGPGT